MRPAGRVERRAAVAIGVLSVLLMMLPAVLIRSRAHAGPDHAPTTGKPPPSSIPVTVSSPGTSSSEEDSSGGGGASGLPDCDDVWHDSSLDAAGPGDPLWEVGDLDAGAMMEFGGVIYKLVPIDCSEDGVPDTVYRWREQTTVDDLIAGAYDDAVGLIPVTAVTFTPPADGVRTFVNVPTWFAYSPSEEWASTPPGEATAGPFHARVTVEPASLEFSPGGEGEAVSCAGPGRVPDPEELLAGDECSFTYRAPGVFQASVTAHWEVHVVFWQDGQSPSIDRVEDFPQSTSYTVTVAEIQTIGEEG